MTGSSCVRARVLNGSFYAPRARGSAQTTAPSAGFSHYPGKQS